MVHRIYWICEMRVLYLGLIHQIGFRILQVIGLILCQDKGSSRQSASATASISLDSNGCDKDPEYHNCKCSQVVRLPQYRKQGNR